MPSCMHACRSQQAAAEFAEPAAEAAADAAAPALPPRGDNAVLVLGATGRLGRRVVKEVCSHAG